MKTTMNSPETNDLKTVLYAVNSGSYSDYGICAIFSSRENAERYMAALPNNDYNDIEEYTLDEWSDEIKRGLTFWTVRMYRDGTLIEVERSNYLYRVAWDGSVHWYTTGHWNPPQPWANFNMWAEGSEAAVKIANERRIQALAMEPPQSALNDLKEPG